ncbi:MAG: hypothetical protein PWP18_684 [Thermoanaerobacter sp.]|jgi:hypothetical protein|nr:hypothetical protein [Thermoanaerobacter sp.]MBZ4656258.1 hypothetical protein [Thermoanaerobacter sp.]MDI3501058.1 hypothetical protein [Thermoanaerobacter sp.]MDI3529629.1 hypothetical protein [Thermoanaerobacter sp.]MDK2814771.1 hypothetical protein [Thermoanaerobacter sp.]
MGDNRGREKFVKFNKGFFNWAAWLTLLLAYVLPYQSTDGFAIHYGYPFAFLTTYNDNLLKAKITLLTSTSFNMGIFAIDVVIIYFAIYFANELLIKWKSKKS